MSGSGAISPSIENTPSVTTMISRYGPAPSGRPFSVASRRMSRRAATSLWGKTFLDAFELRELGLELLVLGHRARDRANGTRADAVLGNGLQRRLAQPRVVRQP